MDGIVSNRADALASADWRRVMGEVYAGVRARPDHGAQTWEGWRAVRGHIYATHPASPLASAAAADLTYFDYDPGVRFLVGTTNPLDTEIVSVEAADGVIELEPVLETVGLAARLGRELTIFQVGGYAGGFYLPFADISNGKTTHVGGRMLLDHAMGADLGVTEDGRLVLDFNFAYNPPSAYSAHRVTPTVPVRNRLDVAVDAGQRAD